MNSLQTWESCRQLLGKQRAGISHQWGFSCRGCLLGEEEPDYSSWFAVGFLPYHGPKGGSSPRAALGYSTGSGAALWGPRLARGGGCPVLPGLGEGEQVLSCTVQRCTVNRRKQMHTDLQWPSRVLHRIVTATPGTGTIPGAPLLPTTARGLAKAHVQSEGSHRKAKTYGGDPVPQA